MRALEEVIIKTCSFFGLDCSRNSKHTGVWLGNKKIAAIGIKVSRWITMHGFAFNVNTDLNAFPGNYSLWNYRQRGNFTSKRTWKKNRPKRGQRAFNKITLWKFLNTIRMKQFQKTIFLLID